jgi:hypothetical protein
MSRRPSKPQADAAESLAFARYWIRDAERHLKQGDIEGAARPAGRALAALTRAILELARSLTRIES